MVWKCIYAHYLVFFSGDRRAAIGYVMLPGQHLGLQDPNKPLEAKLASRNLTLESTHQIETDFLRRILPHCSHTQCLCQVHLYCPSRT